MYLSEPIFIVFNFLLISFAIGLAFLFSIREVYYNIVKESTTLYVFIFFIFILIAFRTRGWDVEQYYNIYYSIDINELSLNSWTEPGYLFANYIFRLFDADYFLFNLFFSLILSIFIFYSVKLNSYYFIVSIFFLFLFYFFRGPYGQIRQALSILIFFYSIKYVTYENRSLKKYFIINVFASLFHGVSLMALLVPFFIGIKLNKKRIMFSLMLASTILLANCLLFNINDYILLTQDISVLSKIYYYVTNYHANGSYFNPDTARIIFIYVVLLMWPNDKLIIPGTLLHTQIIIFILGAISYSILAFDFRVASRISSFYYLIDIFILSNFIYSINNRIYKLFYFCIFSFIGLIYLIYEIMMMSNSEIKYEWSF